MNLYDRCVDLQVKLQAAQSADANDELLARGQRLTEGLDRASNYLEGVAAFRIVAAIDRKPDVELRSVTQAITAFRAGLTPVLWP